jgi:hypothetical protein
MSLHAGATPLELSQNYSRSWVGSTKSEAKCLAFAFFCSSPISVRNRVQISEAEEDDKWDL